MPGGGSLKPRRTPSAVRAANYEILRLTQELAWLRTMAHVVPVAIFRSDESGTCTYVNDAWSELTGRSAGEAIGMSWQAAIHPDDVGAIRASWQEALESRRTMRVEHRYVRPSGRAVWVLSEVAREMDGAGRCTGYTGMSTNITELRLMREKLERANASLGVRIEERVADLQRMEDIVANVDDAVISADLDGRITSWNRGAETIFGFTAAEVLAQSIELLAFAGRREQMRGYFQDLVGGQEIHRVETTARTRGGGVVDVVFSGAPLRDRQGRINGAWVIVRNVTEQKKAEQALRESEERYRLLAENTDDFVVLIDRHGERLHVSPSYFRVTGWTREEVCFTDWRVRVHPDDLAAAERAHEENLAGLSNSVEHRILCADGSSIWVEQRCRPLIDASGQVEKLLLFARDITARRRAAEALRESEERLRLALENAEHGLWDWDIGSGREFLDDRWYAIHGYAPREREPRYELWAESIHPEDRERVLTQLQRHLESDDACYDVDYRARRKDGEWVWVNTRGRVIQRDEHGRALRMMGTLCDISARKEAERKLQQLSRHLMQAQDAERRRLARELHDSTGQTVAALAMNLAALARQENPLTDARRREILADSLTLARSATSELRTIACILHPPLLEERGLSAALGWLATSVGDRSGIEVRLSIAPDFERLPSELETGIFRVAQESLHNAFRHSGSTVVEISLTRKGRKLTLRVRDYGCGLPAAVADGAGVGLASMRERLLQFGGTLTIEPADPGTRVVACFSLSP